MHSFTRRNFLHATAAALAITAIPAAPQASTQYPWAASPEDYSDPVTGARIRILSPPDTTADVIYQTHPMWIRGTDYLVFTMHKDGITLPYARQMASGILRPIDDNSVGPFVLHTPKHDLYFVRDRAIHRQNVLAAFQRPARAIFVAALPPYVDEISGGMSFDAGQKVLYTGFRYTDEERWGVAALDLRTNLWGVITPFAHKIGHLQAHPAIPNVLLFCHETGGDAPQRMWRYIVGDTEPLPFYKEWYEEWTTHEVWWANSNPAPSPKGIPEWSLNRVLFTIWPYDEEREKGIYGIVSVDGEGQDFRVHSRYKAWHTHGSPNGEYILGDDHDRNLWLIRAATGERRLLTQGHRRPGFDTHPHASFTPDSRAIVFNTSAPAREAIAVVEIPLFDSLPLPPP